jgi:hypothetical protein
MKEIGGFLEFKTGFFNKNNGIRSGFTYFISGREALRYLVSNLGITILYLPSYFCNDVQEYLQNILHLEIKTYSVDDQFRVITSTLKTVQIAKGDKVGLLMVDFFGRRDPKYNLILQNLKKKGVVVLTDRTHSVLNTYPSSSVAEFASVRKLLINLPGAYIKGNEYKGGYRKLHLDSSLALLDLKDKYLKNGDLRLKNRFLKEYLHQEKRYPRFPKILRAVEPSGLENILRKANLNKMRKIRQRNYQALEQAFVSTPQVKWHHLQYRKNEAPAFALVKCSNYKTREKLKAYLIKNAIYPPIHWNNGTNLSRLLLSIPIDHRYSPKEMLFVASVINNCKLAKL